MISVNGCEIPEATIRAEMQYHPAASREEAREAAAAALVVRQLLLEEARCRGVAADDEEETVRNLLAEAVNVPEPDEESCRRYYEKNRKKLRSPDRFEASHILFPAPPTDGEARAAAKKLAEETIAELAGNPARFAEMAALRSKCPSAAEGGDLGVLSRGQTTAEFETFLYHVELGICPAPVPTRYGYHVLWLKARTLGACLDYEVARSMVADYMRESTWRRAVNQYIQVLAGRAQVEGIDIKAASTPLVQ